MHVTDLTWSSAAPHRADKHEPPSRAPQSLNSRGSAGNNALSMAVLAVMMVMAVSLFWFPVRRMFANVEINYNEGWNAYQAARVSAGIPLYRTPPGSFATGTGYPPISFHLVSALGNSKTFVAIGRWLALISLVTTGIFVALIVSWTSGSQVASIFSFLLYEIAIALLLPDRIGMNDPQLLAEGLSIAGLYFYVRNPASIRLLCVSAMLFCLSGFTKQTLIAFPAAVSIDLVLRSREKFLVWVGAMSASGGLLAALTFLIDGRYLLVHLTGKRSYSYWVAWSQFHRYALLFQTLLVIACASAIWALRSQRVLALAFLLSNCLAFQLAGGAGVDMNMFFNPLAAAVVVCGCALSDISFPGEDWNPSLVNSMAVLMFAFVFISVGIFVPGQLRRDRENMKALSELENQFRSAVEFVNARPGPALCESLLLCYEAGKSFEFEPFTVGDQMRTGQINEEDVLQLIKTHHFQTVEVALRSDEQGLKDWTELQTSLGSDQTEPDKQRRFPPSFMNELLADYHLGMRTPQMALFIPN